MKIEQDITRMMQQQKKRSPETQQEEEESRQPKKQKINTKQTMSKKRKQDQIQTETQQQNKICRETGKEFRSNEAGDGPSQQYNTTTKSPHSPVGGPGDPSPWGARSNADQSYSTTLHYTTLHYTTLHA